VSLTGSVPANQTWLKGNKYTSDSTSPKISSGELITTTRSAALIDSAGSFYTVVPPTYEDVAVADVVNVQDHSVPGDGTTDVTAALQAVINSAATSNQVVFIPSGAYILTDTLKIPKGSRIVGEGWPQLMASGTKFSDIKNPRPMVQVGSSGDVGK
jgi:glucan 1,3-beta-glucosidase